MIWTPEKVLAISPHADDIELGAGGTIHKWKDSEIRHLVLSTLKKPVLRTPEIMLANEILGIPKENVYIADFENRNFNKYRQEILQMMIDIGSFGPDVVLVPCSMDTHQDHQIVHSEAKRAFRKTTILGYEDPWNMYRTDMRMIHKLSQEDITVKWRAAKAHVSQMDRPYMKREFIGGMALTRGMVIQAQFGEAFEVVRWII